MSVKGANEKRQLGPGIVKIVITFLICMAAVIIVLTFAFAGADKIEATVPLIDKLMDLVKELGTLLIAFAGGGMAGGGVAYGALQQGKPKQ